MGFRRWIEELKSHDDPSWGIEQRAAEDAWVAHRKELYRAINVVHVRKSLAGGTETKRLYEALVPRWMIDDRARRVLKLYRDDVSKKRYVQNGNDECWEMQASGVVGWSIEPTKGKDLKETGQTIEVVVDEHAPGHWNLAWVYASS